MSEQFKPQTNEGSMFTYRKRKITSGGVYLVRSPMDGNDTNWESLAAFEPDPQALINAITKTLEVVRSKELTRQ
jgi:hypothetical protein